MTHKTKHFYEFGPFRLDAGERLLFRNGEAMPLTPKALDLLLALVERHGHLLEKEELFRTVWPDSFVEESNLSSNIAVIRKALGESSNGQRYIETVPKRGYRFVAKVREVEEKGAAAPTPAASASAALETAKRVSEFASSPVGGHGRGARAAAMALIVLLGMAWGLYKFFLRGPSLGAPLEPRVVPFTSFPHNELDPAFSPDGNQIAFAWDGEAGDNYDIWVKQVGTDARMLRLTTHPAAERTPVWSPDGRYIAFTRISQESGVELYLVPSIGGPERKLTVCDAAPENLSSASFNFSPVSWSPDGAWLAVAGRTSAGEAPGIFLVARETGEKRRLTTPPGGANGDGFPAFSPDGKTLAFARHSGRSSELYLAPVAGGDAKRLTFDHANARNPVWISEGREILFDSNPGDVGGLWKLPATGGTAVRVWPIPQAVRSFARSKQGQLAWSQPANDVNIWRFDLADAAPPAPLIASTRIDTSPQFSPDDQRIAFVSDRSGSKEIWISSRNGQDARQITFFRGPQVGSPRWSPDGQQIVFDASVAGNDDIYIVGADGGSPRRLTTEESQDIVPSFSHDGKWIYFCSNRSGSQPMWQIWKLPAAGGQAVQLTREGGFESMESPDGQYLYYAKGRGMPGIWRVPVTGGKEEHVLDHHRAGAWRYWTITPQGIYFLTAETPERPLLEFFNFTTNNVALILTLEKKIPSGSSSLSVSHDGRTLIWSQLDQEGSDIMLLENLP